jgi:hypothetical protein
MTNFEKAQANGYHIRFNGSSTWMIIDEHGDCFGYYNTERKAQNAMNRIGKCYA